MFSQRCFLFFLDNLKLCSTLLKFFILTTIVEDLLLGWQLLCSISNFGVFAVVGLLCYFLDRCWWSPSPVLVVNITTFRTADLLINYLFSARSEKLWNNDFALNIGNDSGSDLDSKSNSEMSFSVQSLCTWFCTFYALLMFLWKFNHNTLIYLMHSRLPFFSNMQMGIAVSLIMSCAIICSRYWTTMCLELGFEFYSF